MAYVMDGAAQQRMAVFFDRIGEVLGNKRRKASFATYAVGLLGDGERKSMEPIASRATASPKEIDAVHQRLGHFLKDSEWSDREVRREGTREALEAMTAENPVETWIVDDTGMLKQGSHSVGVQRQYTGSAGKVTNCQVAVSLSVTTRSEHLPIDFELYLPRSWTEDAARRAEARVPDEVTFKTKPEQALDMMDRALGDGVPRGVVLADEGYGNSSEWRGELRKRGLDYAVAVNATTTVWIPDKRGGLGVKWSVRQVADIISEGRFRQTVWRHATRGPLHARFAVRRVVVAHDDGQPPKEREPVWLLMEWREGDTRPEHFYLSTLPANTSRKKLVRIIKERYRTERIYEDLKGELGWDHFEGRRFRGWHHHVSVAMCCYAFITAEKVRAFSPSARGARRSPTERRPPRAPLPGFLHHGTACDCAPAEHLAPALPSMPPPQPPADVSA
jgi:SRSO17 transposase